MMASWARLEAIGAGIHALFYKAGERTGDRDLGREVDILMPTDEDLADRPQGPPPDLWYAGGTHRLTFTGYYVVPGSGLAAIYGATARPIPGRE